MLDVRFLEGVREARASGHYMSTFAAAKAESLFGALLPFFQSESLGKFDCVGVHGIGVLDDSGGRGKRLEGLSRPSTSLSDLFGTIPLILEVSHLGVPVIDLVRDSVMGHDPLHEWGGNSGGKETNQDIMVHDAGVSGVTLEG